jgi:hypothetical protein
MGTATKAGARHNHQRDETTLERLDRNTVELLNELRVAGTGIQVLFAFPLIVPFNTGFRRVSEFDKGLYFVGLVCIGIAAVLLIAPSIHHRLLFRMGQKSYLVKVGSRFVIVAMGFLSVGLTSILVMISNFVFGAVAAVVMCVLAASTVVGLWFGVPLARRRAIRR